MHSVQNVLLLWGFTKINGTDSCFRPGYSLAYYCVDSCMMIRRLEPETVLYLVDHVPALSDLSPLIRHFTLFIAVLCLFFNHLCVLANVDFIVYNRWGRRVLWCRPVQLFICVQVPFLWLPSPLAEIPEIIGDLDPGSRLPRLGLTQLCYSESLPLSFLDMKPVLSHRSIFSQHEIRSLPVYSHIGHNSGNVDVIVTLFKGQTITGPMFDLGEPYSYYQLWQGHRQSIYTPH